ncbi:MAG: hypothetical protein ACREYD_16520 [Casimicrobiaceae bacterium]
MNMHGNFSSKRRPLLTRTAATAAADPATRDVIQTVYIRRIEMRDGHYWNREFDKIENVKDPGA